MKKKQELETRPWLDKDLAGLANMIAENGSADVAAIGGILLDMAQSLRNIAKEMPEIRASAVLLYKHLINH